MHYISLTKSLPKIFNIEVLETVLKTNKSNAKILCSRYVRKGYFLRIKRNLYLLEKDFKSLSPHEMRLLARKIQNPSYISFQSALIYHGIYHSTSNLIQPILIQSVSPVRSFERKIKNITWKFFRFPKKYFFGFEEVYEGYFVAEPEKVIVDIIYLNSIGKHFDYMKQINVEHLSQEKMLKYAEVFPKRTQKLLKVFLKHRIRI